MKAIELIAVGTAGLQAPIGAASGAHPSSTLLDELTPVLARTFGVECRVGLETMDAVFAFDPGRNQYHSTAILQRLDRLARETDAHLLGVTPLDLYVPVLTFVFGEAQLGGRCALVSLHRLREEFYGLPANNDLLRERLAKEAVHELGHTFGLRHCGDWRCVMASTHAVERLDTKGTDFCPACQRVVTTTTAAPLSP
jgi:archaemetzincin